MKPDSTGSNAVSAVCMAVILVVYGVALLSGKLVAAFVGTIIALLLGKLTVWLATRKADAQRRELKRLYGDRV